MPSPASAKRNLDLQGADPLLTVYGRHDEAVPVDLPRFDAGRTEGGTSVRRGVPAVRVAGRLVTTVFDLLMAQYAVPRDGLPGEWPENYDDASAPGTPAWQEAVTSVPAAAAARVAREFARSAELVDDHEIRLWRASRDDNDAWSDSNGRLSPA